MKARVLIASAALGGMCLGGLPEAAYAYRVGMTGKAQEGCGGAGCHMGGMAPSVSLIGPDTVAPGAEVDFILRVSGGQVAAGANIEASDGLLFPVDDTIQNLGGQLTHNRDYITYDEQGMQVDIMFAWQAPDTLGRVTLWAAANSVNTDGASTGDLWALTETSIEIAEGGGAGGEGGAGGAGGDGGAGGGQGGADGGVDAGSGGGDDGCRVAPGSSGSPVGGALALLGLGWVARRRRR